MLQETCATVVELPCFASFGELVFLEIRESLGRLGRLGRLGFRVSGLRLGA